MTSMSITADRRLPRILKAPEGMLHQPPSLLRCAGHTPVSRAFAEDAHPGAIIVWHPGNYMFYGVSDQIRTRIPDLHFAGVNLTLGTDVAKVWVFGDLRWLAYLVVRQVSLPLRAENILEMMTIGGARAAGLQGEIGKAREHRHPDQRAAGRQPNLNVVRQIALVSRTKSIDTVSVNSEIVVRKGSLTRFDERAVYARAQASGYRMARGVDMPLGSIWPRRR